MKMLIAQEMSKEGDSIRDPPNLVAKLMGLDALPRKQSQKSPHLARYVETANDRNMAHVRQKFFEAKLLSMNEKLHQSKQFQDALEVLNSNKDLFLKCLEEPDSKFSENLYSQQAVTHHQERKRIIVLRPSKLGSDESSGAVNKYRKQMKKGALLESDLKKVHPEICTSSSLEYYENPIQPKRIVVLKPSPGRAHGAKTVGPPYPELRRMFGRENFFGDVEYDENQESREVAKTITQQMRKKLGRHRIDETLISSVLSNGYVGDESSFRKSELEYADGDLRDSEAMSSVSRHSWDYVNRLSPYSSSSFTQTFYSPESSVSREAKKCLSERWAMMTSTATYQEKRNSQRSSSTLGEMLALSETKTASSYGEEGSSSREPKNSDILLVSEQCREENRNHSPRNLMRSKSVPVSSTEFEMRLNIGNSVSNKGKSESLKGDTKARSAKSLLKGKVTSLLFSRYKKPTEYKPLDSDTMDEFYVFPEEICFDRTECLSDNVSVHASPLLEPSMKASFSNLICEHSMISPENVLLVEQPIALGNAGENLDRPSPISVLDPLSEEDEHVAKASPHYAKPDQQGVRSWLKSVGSNLIDKSPLIGSIAHSLSWDDSCLNTTSSQSPKKLLTTQETDEEEREWFFLVKALLSVAGLQGEVQSDSFWARWHSPDSPLDPSLRDKYIDLNDKTLHDAKQRQKSAYQKLVFDCVNAALLDIAGYESGQRATPFNGAINCILDSTSSTILDEVWTQMNGWFSGEVRGVSDDYGDYNSLMVERLIRKEVAGEGWSNQFRLEMDNLGQEIKEKLLEEIVLEVMIGLTGRV